MKALRSSQVCHTPLSANGVKGPLVVSLMFNMLNVEHGRTCVVRDGLLCPFPKHPTILTTTSSDTLPRGNKILTIFPIVDWSRQQGVVAKTPTRAPKVSLARPRTDACCESLSITSAMSPFESELRV